jgi:hypothetical protein
MEFDSMYTEIPIKVIKDSYKKSVQLYKVTLPKAMDVDEFGTPNLKEFILKFEERVMVIFDAILQENRVLFTGTTQQAKTIAEYVFT